MQDQYSGEPGSFVTDSEAGVRIPAEDWDIYQADKPAYLADPKAAIAAFNTKSVKPAPKRNVVEEI
jgi:hypothetical protein